ncbi:taste receptor type 1 member 1-like, partial [Clarias magur]
ISYGASSYDLSDKWLHPSFLRTVPTNQDIIMVIIKLIQQFEWNWVAFISSDDSYSQNGLKLFRSNIKATSICLAFSYEITLNSNFTDVLKRIESLSINVIVVFTEEGTARALVKTAVKINIRDKVWIAGDAWSMDAELSTWPGIGQIGTIFGITAATQNLPEFDEFVYETRLRDENDACVNCEGIAKCSQVCDDCMRENAENIIDENPTYSFFIQAAVYTFAYALHHMLNCSMTRCNPAQDIPPYVLLKEMKTLNFLLLGRTVKYDRNGDSPVFYDVVFWRLDAQHAVFERIGTYNTYPQLTFTINNSLIGWDRVASVPFANCSAECPVGFIRQMDQNHACCFQCKMCEINTYVNYT